MTSTVGVRELRQNISIYLRRIAQGERFVVTERRTPVAVLGPPPSDDDPWEQLLTGGRISEPTRDLLDAAAPVPLDDPYSGTTSLDDVRSDRPE